MEKSIHELIVNEALDILKEIWEQYENPSFLNDASFEDVLDAYKDYLEAKRIQYELCRMSQRLSREQNS